MGLIEILLWLECGIDSSFPYAKKFVGGNLLQKSQSKTSIIKADTSKSTVYWAHYEQAP
jgi:hypothetical protein